MTGILWVAERKFLKTVFVLKRGIAGQSRKLQSGITGTRKQEAQGIAGEHKPMNPVKRCITSGSPERQNQKGTHTHTLTHTDTHTHRHTHTGLFQGIGLCNCVFGRSEICRAGWQGMIQVLGGEDYRTLWTHSMPLRCTCTNYWKIELMWQKSFFCQETWSPFGGLSTLWRILLFT